MSAKMWRVDPLIQSEFALDCSIALHRNAGRFGLSTTPKRSNIDGNYFCEINRIVGDSMQENVAMGTGTTPLYAAIDGYSKLIDHPIISISRLEIETHYLCQKLRLAQAIENALNCLLTDLEKWIGTIKP